MTSIELPDVLWTIDIRYEYPAAPPYDVSTYTAELRFCDASVYTERYSETENPAVFEHSRRYNSANEEVILDDFKSKCAYKMNQIFHSWGGPVR